MNPLMEFQKKDFFFIRNPSGNCWKKYLGINEEIFTRISVAILENTFELRNPGECLKQISGGIS